MRVSEGQNMFSVYALIYHRRLYSTGQHNKQCCTTQRTERGQAERQGADGGPEAARVQHDSLPVILATLLLLSLRPRPRGPRSGACWSAKDSTLRFRD